MLVGYTQTSMYKSVFTTATSERLRTKSVAFIPCTFITSIPGISRTQISQLYTDHYDNFFVYNEL